MGLWKEIIRRAGYLGRRRQFERELDEEARFHLEERDDELEESGLARDQAVLQARRELGSMARLQEDAGPAWQVQWLEDAFSDLRYAMRSFRRDRAFALTAIVCLALGIGANTTIFSIATEVLFSEPSGCDTGTLLNVMIGGSSSSFMWQYTFVRDAKVFEGLAGDREFAEVNWHHGEATERLFAHQVTDNFFEMAGVPVAMGRPIQRGDEGVAVISYRFWQGRLGGSADAIGRPLLLDGRPYTVIGILPANHRTFLGFGLSPDLYMPVIDQTARLTFYARQPLGITRQALLAKLTVVCQQLDRIYPDGDNKWAHGIKITPVSGIERLRDQSELMSIAAFFAMLMAVVGLVLLVACANVASLLLARASSRAQELAIRLSIGASRGRIVRQLLAESFLLAMCGMCAGLLLNVWLTTILSQVELPLPFPVVFHIEPDWRLLAYASGIAIASTVMAGLMPALKSTRAGINNVLKQAEHQVGQRRLTLRVALVTGQLAVSVVLLSAAVLFMRNLVEAATMNPGFDVGHTVWASMRLVPESYVQPEKTRGVVDAALQRLRGLPGVESAAVTRMVPLNDNTTMRTDIRTDLDQSPKRVAFYSNRVGPEYFKTMGIPILGGREFVESDRKGAVDVAIVNENFARRVFGDINPVGHTFQQQEGKPILVVGVAKNSKYFTLGEEGRLAMYSPYAQLQSPQFSLHFLLRSRAPESLVKSINAALLGIDSTAAVETKPMRKAMGLALLPSQVGASILGSAGMLGLTLAAIGLYGVLLYMVGRRTREIGLRMALGATPGGILRMVVGESLTLVAAGIAAGIGLAVLAVRPMAMFLVPGVRPTDPSAFCVVAGVLLLVAMAATVAPAVQALRVNPVTALRHD